MKHNKLDDNETDIQYVKQIYTSKLFENISWINIY